MIRISRSHLPVILGLLLVPDALHAQRRDRDGFRYECESYGRRGRERFCENREMGMRPPRGPLQIDGGANGGVNVIGWDRDSVHIIAHVQATADSREEARELAGRVKVIANGATIEAEGPYSTRNRTSNWHVIYEV